ncbi:hypothetical protein K443DRAFT_14480 [Laccaria amethystina LaAM-08-1]|uniref:Uncharacterized protein n=1 Tax=Laccaria amethystina LaAM-08-1 TaxID=1095629 RepID=A0A0C9WHK2_9AGAR|nr:hypothetical protein K443DRAFT_14480 [Laccaria amethystina LaAM-08-1]
MLPNANESQQVFGQLDHLLHFPAHQVLRIELWQPRIFNTPKLSSTSATPSDTPDSELPPVESQPLEGPLLESPLVEDVPVAKSKRK